MFRGYRSALLAIGLIVLALGGQAQENEQEATGQAQQEQSPAETLPLPFPVEIVEDEAESEARQRQQAEARDREIADLRAQQGMNEATQAMKDYSLWSTIFVAIGTVAVVASLVLMWGANRAAVVAVEVTRDIGQRQTRAYMVISSDTPMKWEYVIPPGLKDVKSYNIQIVWKNCGVTPARRCITRTSLEVFDSLIPGDFTYPDKHASVITEKSHVGPQQFFYSKVGGLSRQDAIAAESGAKRVYVWSWVEYDDVFGGQKRRTEVCFELRIINGGANCIPTIAGPFNGADEDCHHQPKT